MNENCLLCGSELPPGHVPVWEDGPWDEIRRGSVCSAHTLKELILDPRERFRVRVTELEPE